MKRSALSSGCQWPSCRSNDVCRYDKCLGGDEDSKEVAYEPVDTSKVTDIVFSGIDHKDAPDYCDAYITGANYKGVPVTQEELAELNENRDFVYEKLMSHLY